MKATRHPFTSVPRASRGPSCMLPKQGKPGMRAGRAIQERGRRAFPVALKPRLCMGTTIRMLGLRAGRTAPGLGLQPARSKSARA